MTRQKNFFWPAPKKGLPITGVDHGEGHTAVNWQLRGHCTSAARNTGCMFRLKQLMKLC